jgi:hypothetical protein
MSKSMEFPGRSKKYSDNLSQINKTESAPVYIAVPGPQGEKGPKGDTGDKGKDGRQGPKGDPGNPGKDGRNGLNGKPGIDGITKSGQKPGWAVYDNLNKKYIRTGATKGNDGWVQFSSDCLGPLTNENYLPENNVSLYNKLTQRINLKGLKVGSIITIRYDISLVTFSNNTEVWLRTFIPGHDKHPLIKAGVIVLFLLMFRWKLIHPSLILYRLSMFPSTPISTALSHMKGYLCIFDGTKQFRITF